MRRQAVVHRAPAAQGRMLAGVAAATMLVAVAPRVALHISVSARPRVDRVAMMNVVDSNLPLW